MSGQSVTGLSNTVSALVSLLAPFLGGTLAEQLGYRALFVVAMVMAVVALFIAVRFLRDKLVAEMPLALWHRNP
ncbi:MAG: hypothetical protein R2932_59915 [Caldilineaceae bacterium]